MQKLIFLGYVVDPDTAGEYSGISIAGNKMQWNVLQGLVESGKFDVECLTISPLAVFPKEKRLWQKKEASLLQGGIRQTKIPYCNLPVIKQLSQVNSMYKAAVKLLKKNPNAILFAFNLFPQVGIPLRKLKKKFPQARTVCLLADLPIDDKTDRRGFSKFLRNRFDSSTWKSIANCEKFVVLNEYVAQAYLQGKPYVVVDGGLAENELRAYEFMPKGKKNILFCGALTEYNGISNLLKAMELIQDKEIILDVYGGGYLENTVAEYAKTHKNVFYHGKISNEEVMQKQREAWLLINPRKVDDLIAKVTFPSKTFEYMLSGTPILTTRLNGYGAEYNDKMFFTETDSAEDIAKSIDEISQKSESELREITKRAHTFICEQRIWGTQAKKIINFIVGK